MRKTSIIITSLLSMLCISCDQKQESKIKFKDFEISLSKDEEPPLIFGISSEGKTQYFVENQTRKWNLLTKNSDITIRVYDWKLFPHNNIEFEYPRTYSFEADLSIINDIWTLSGNDFTIMVIRPIIETEVKEYVDDMITEFGPSNCTKQEISKRINNSKLNGIKLSVNLAGIDIELDVFEIIDKNGKKSFIVFQDSLTDSKENSKESINTMKRIEQTFKIN